jgi:hypothetical protein
MSNRLLVADDYESLRAILNERRLMCKMTMIELDQRAGLADGHAGKLLCGARNLGPVSLPLILGALGVQLALVEIPKDGKTYRIRAIRRDAFLQNRMSEIARRGALARNAQLTPEERIAASRKASAASALARAKRKQMSLLGKKGGSKTQDQRRARVAEAAELSTDI